MRNYKQIALVVRDVYKTMDQWHHLLGIGPWDVRHFTPETVRDFTQSRPTGLFFDEQTADAIVAAVDAFEREPARIRSEDCRANAERFSVSRFRERFVAEVAKAVPGVATGAGRHIRAAGPLPGRVSSAAPRVLAIDQNIEEKNGQKVVVGKTATLELTPSQAETLALAQRVGTLALSLRSIADASKTDKPDTEGAKSRGGINVVRFGVGTTSR